MTETRTAELAKENRETLDEEAKKLGIDPTDHAKKDDLVEAMVAKEEALGIVAPPPGATTATAQPDTGGAATAPVGGALMGDVRPDIAAQGTDFGSPFDSSRPPWPVYNDPTAEPVRAQMALAEEQREKMAAIDGPEVVFRGHSDPNNGTGGVQTEYGTFMIGDTIKLPEEVRESLESQGYVFDAA